MTLWLLDTGLTEETICRTPGYTVTANMPSRTVLIEHHNDRPSTSQVMF